MLNLLLGEDMNITMTQESSDSGAYTAVYVDTEGEPKALGVCDLPFAAYSAGAMTMMPKDPVDEALRSEDLPEMMFSNLHEVFNICTRLLIDDQTKHIKLQEVSKTTEAELSLSSAPTVSGRADFKIDIPRYGSGTITFVVL